MIPTTAHKIARTQQPAAASSSRQRVIQPDMHALWDGHHTLLVLFTSSNDRIESKARRSGHGTGSTGRQRRAATPLLNFRHS